MLVGSPFPDRANKPWLTQTPPFSPCSDGRLEQADLLASKLPVPVKPGYQGFLIETLFSQLLLLPTPQMKVRAERAGGRGHDPLPLASAVAPFPPAVASCFHHTGTRSVAGAA